MYKNLRLELIKSVEKLDKKGILEIEHFEQLNSVLKEALQNHVNSLYEDLDIMRKEKPQEKLIEDQEEFTKYNIQENQKNINYKDYDFIKNGYINKKYRFNSEYLKQLMNDNNDNIEKLCGIIGCAKITLQNWLYGRHNPKIYYLEKIADRYNVKEEKLLILKTKNEKKSKILKYRLKRGLNQEDLAKLVEVNVNKIIMFEKNRIKPSKREIKELARVLKVKENELV